MPVCGNYLFFELPKKIVLNPKDGKDALRYGNKTILMKSGRVAMELVGEERAAMTVEKLIEKFSIDNDRMLL